MKKIIFILSITLSISACGQSVTRQDAETGATSAYDQFSGCLADQYQKKAKTEHPDDIPNAVISSCAEPLAVNVEYEYILAASDPNGNPGREGRDEFSERVTAEKVKEAKVLIGSWVAQSK